MVVLELMIRAPNLVNARILSISLPTMVLSGKMLTGKCASSDRGVVDLAIGVMTGCWRCGVRLHRSEEKAVASN